MLVLWGDKAGCYIQLIHFSFAVGATTAPLIMRPYLVSNSRLEDSGSLGFISVNTSAHDTNVEVGIMSNIYGTISNKTDNQTYIYLDSIDLYSAQRNHSSAKLHSTNQTLEREYNSKAIMWIFTIIAIMKAVIVLGIIIHLCFSKFNLRALKRTKLKPKVSKSKKTQGLILFLVFLLMVVLFVAGGLEVTYGGLVLTYSVNHLHWSQSSAALLASLFWGFLAIGRGIGAFVTRYDRSHLILLVNLCMLCIASTAITFAGGLHSSVMWISTAIFGVALSTVLSNGILLVQRFKEVTGIVSSVLIVAFYTGMISVPAFSGYLFQVIGEVTFSYIILASSLLALFSLILVMLLKQYQEPTKESNNNVIVIDVSPDETLSSSRLLKSGSNY